MARKAKRPKAIPVGSRVKVRAIRGPHADDPARWYWRAEAYDPATQKRSTVWTGWATSRDAEATVTRIVAEVPDLTARATVTEITTVRDLVECWQWHVENKGGRKGPLSASSLRVYQYASRHLISELATVRVDRLTLPVVEGYRDARLGGGAAPATVGSEIRVLGYAYRWWGDRSPRPLAPFPRVEVKPRSVRNRYTPTRDEVLAVLGKLDGWARITTLLLYGTGARPGEIRDLGWSDLDLDRAEVHLDGKTGPRTVPLGADVVDALRAWADGLGEDRGETVLGVTVLSFNSYYGPRLLRAACKAAKVPVFTPYGLRRAAVDAMARAGVDVATAASVTGHSPEVMLRKYRTVTDEDRRRAVELAGLGTLGAPKVLPFRGKVGE